MKNLEKLTMREKIRICDVCIDTDMAFQRQITQTKKYCTSREKTPLYCSDYYTTFINNGSIVRARECLYGKDG